MYKDVKLCLDEAEALGVPNDIMSAVGALWQTDAERDRRRQGLHHRGACRSKRRAGVEVKAK